MKSNLHIFLVMPFKWTVHLMARRHQHRMWTGTDMLDNILGRLSLSAQEHCCDIAGRDGSCSIRNIGRPE
jgi:hypothetical protein